MKKARFSEQRIPWAHSFPKTVLKHFGHKIYVNNKQVLLQTNPQQNHTIKNLKTYLFLGDNIADEPEETKYRHITVDRLKAETGYTVISKKIGAKAWFPRQSVYYYIAKTTVGQQELIKPNIHHYIEHDEYNQRVRGIGDCFANPDAKSGRTKTDWVYYDPPPKIMPRKVWAESDEDLIESIEAEWLDQTEEKDNIQHIKELPVMITNNNYLLCIPNPKDVHRILFVGNPGYGKSFGLNSVLGRIFYIWEAMIGMLNDNLGQFGSIGISNRSKGQRRLLYRLGNEPLPLPAIYLYMGAPHLQMPHYKEGVGFRLVMSAHDFIGRYPFFSYGIKRWALEGKEKYLMDIKKQLSGCRDAKEFKNLLFQKFGGTQGEEALTKDRGIKQMIMKMHDAFSDIYSEQFLDAQFKGEHGTAAEWKLEKADGETLVGHPFVIAAEADLLPVIDTIRASHTTYFRNSMADILQKILAWQIQRKQEGKQRKFYVAIDELQTIYEIGKKRDNAADALEALFRQGRFNKVGFLANSQSFEKLHEDIRKYCTHLFCTNIPDEPERVMIKKKFQWSKEQANELGELERFEFMASSTEPWVVYNSYGQKKVVRNPKKIFRGKIIPPINTHLSP